VGTAGFEVGAASSGGARCRQNWVSCGCAALNGAEGGSRRSESFLCSNVDFQPNNRENDDDIPSLRSDCTARKASTAPWEAASVRSAISST
jgi:hypothetical protein